MRMLEFTDIRRGRELVHVNPLLVSWVEEDFNKGGVVLSMIGGREIVTPLDLDDVLRRLAEAIRPVPHRQLCSAA
jgi:hypothetical protein